MASEHHQNPIFNLFYVTCGVIFSLVQSNNIYVEGTLEVVKVFLLGGVGAIGAYIFKNLAERTHNWLKKRAKEKCK